MAGSDFIVSDNREFLRRKSLADFERNRAAQAQQPSLPETLAARADPYSRQRDQLINDPAGALESSPFFKFMQDKYVNAATAKNAASGNNRSGRGLMALGEASQRASADFLLPYLKSLGDPSAGANAFWQGYQYQNPRITNNVSSGGGSRRPLSSFGGAPQEELWNGVPRSQLFTGSQAPGWTAQTGQADISSYFPKYKDPSLMSFSELNAEAYPYGG